MWGHLLESWSSLYSNHSALRTAVEFVHIGGLMVGGGCAVSADIATLAAARREPAGRRGLHQRGSRTHRLVLVGLIALFASGFLLLAADVDTYWYSRVFWIKMAMIAVLLGNGARLVAGERQVDRGDDQAWPRLARSAAASLALWLLTTLAGAALPNIG